MDRACRSRRAACVLRAKKRLRTRHPADPRRRRWHAGRPRSGLCRRSEHARPVRALPSTAFPCPSRPAPRRCRAVHRGFRLRRAGPSWIAREASRDPVQRLDELARGPDDNQERSGGPRLAAASAPMVPATTQRLTPATHRSARPLNGPRRPPRRSSRPLCGWHEPANGRRNRGCLARARKCSWRRKNGARQPGNGQRHHWGPSRQPGNGQRHRRVWFVAARAGTGALRDTDVRGQRGPSSHVAAAAPRRRGVVARAVSHVVCLRASRGCVAGMRCAVFSTRDHEMSNTTFDSG